MTFPRDMGRARVSAWYVRAVILLSAVVLASCQLVGGIGGKILVTEAGDGGAGEAGEDATPGVNPPLPASCEDSDPLYDEAAWPVPADGPDGTNYEVDAANGTALDKTTGLMWIATTAPAASWHDAKCACRALTTGGFGDWRVPSAVELVSIVDYAKNIDPTGSGTTVAATNTTVFPDTRLDSYWSATPQPRSGLSQGMPYLVDFGRGNTADATVVTVPGPSRCVRTARPRPTGSRYVPNTETVVDTFTTLEWQRVVSNVQLAPAEAAGYCKSLDLHGRQDWRLPTVKELASLWVPAKYPSIDPDAFPSTPSLQYATATRYGADPSNSAWTVDFGGAEIILSPSDVAFYVRCVRGA